MYVVLIGSLFGPRFNLTVRRYSNLRLTVYLFHVLKQVSVTILVVSCDVAVHKLSG